MNPFPGKTLTQLRDGVPGCSNPELDALAACVCHDGWVQYFERHPKTNHKRPGWYRYKGWEFWLLLSVNNLSRFAPTTDWREAGWLLEKYWIHIRPIIPEHPDEHTKPYWTIVYANRVWRKMKSGGRHDSPRRAITETAVIAALTKWIEGDGDAND